MGKRWLTTGEMAAFCGVSFRTVIRWIERNELKASQLPGRGDKRIEVRECIDFMQKHGMDIPAELQEFSSRVLIVDDDALMASSIQRVLRGAGFETMVAHDGFIAGTLLGTFKPSVITLDINMPGLSGMEVLRQIRSVEQLSSVKIIIISAMPLDELTPALAAGANDILEKPFHNHVLLEKVKKLAGFEPSPSSHAVS